MTHVLVTRPAAQADDLQRRLADRGIRSTAVPTVAVEAVGCDEHLVSALAGLGPDAGRPAAEWLVLTSVNGAHAVLDCLRQRSIALPDATRIAAVGPATASALEAAGTTVHHVPDEYLTVAIADGLGDVRGRRIVLARADIASDELAAALRERGALVEEVVAYRTVEGPSASRAPLRRALETELDGITFTSGSTVRGLVRLLHGHQRERAANLPAFCIGPVTADVARRAGFVPAVVARDHTSAGLADAVADYFRGSPA